MWLATRIALLTYLVGGIYLLNKKYKTRGVWEGIGEKDIAVITGGSNGLGLELVKLLTQRHVRCVVVDREDISDKDVSRDVVFHKCDLSDAKLVLNTINQIKSQMGQPTILINNAAMRHFETLQELTYDQIKTVMTVNTLTPVMFMKELLTSPSRLYTVNISSILGLASPANLTLYSATKASLISLHDSVSHEMSHDNSKRFLLVTPGQLDTRMFKDVKPPKQFLAPVVNAKTLAEQIVRCIEQGERGTLHGPMYTYFMPILKLLPYSVCEFCRWFSEMDNSVSQGKVMGKDE